MALVQQSNDIAALWEEALDGYKKVTDIDMRSCLTAQRSVNSIMMDQQRQLENFTVFRHNKGKLDKFRTLISSNADIIQGVAKHVADAASAAFPPSSAILTAFTFVMTASKHVSDDYDMIEGFFSIMQSFLQRLSLLEDKIPPQRAFQAFLVNVFSSLLKLSAIARAYCAKGRFSKWAKALVDGKDPDLNAAYGTLNGNLQELESAIIMQTLRTTIEISEDTRATNQGVKAIQGQLGGIAAMSMQSLETGQQTFAVTLRTETRVQELLDHSLTSASSNNEMLRLQNTIARKLNKMQSKDNKDKQRKMKSGASGPVNFERLRMDYLKNEAEGGIVERMADMELSCVAGLFDWIQADSAFENIVNEEENFLSVSAPSGMGKSTLSFRMYRHLEERYSFESTTCVAWFPFDEEHPEMRSVSNMLKCCSIQIAKADTRYCTDTLGILQRDDEALETVEDTWAHLFASRYTKDSDRRLILILDGIDQTTEEDFLSLMKLLGRIKSQESPIQVIFTCDPDKKQDSSLLEAKCIDLTRDKVLRDMRKFIWSRTKTLSRLRKLRIDVRKAIRKKVMQKADSFLYIDHMMRRLNAIGREGPITKELDILPENTPALYHALFEECQKSRTSEDRELLRNLLAWLAYMKTKFTVAEANLLVEIMNKEHALSIEEELDGRLSRLLRISGDREQTEQDESSENEDRQENANEEQEEAEDRAEDANNFLGFQERSLKAYFRNAIQDHPSGLRCTSAEAHAIIFRTCATILTMPKKNQKPSGPGPKLLDYASIWGLSHLLQIDPDEEGSISDDLAKTIIESIYNVFTNKNESLKPLEQRAGSNMTILSGDSYSQEEVLSALSSWGKRAFRLSPNQLPYGILDWFRPLQHQPLRVLIGLSRAHITNWFSSNDRASAYYAFISAHAALQEGESLPELKQNHILEAYLVQFKEGGERFTERSFEVVAGSFWDIVKTSSSYKGIGMAMKAVGLYEPAVKELNKGLEDDSIDKFEQLVLLISKGDALLWLGSSDPDDKEKSKRYLEESLSILTQANEAYRQITQIGQIDDDLRTFASTNFANTAHAAALLGKADLVLSVTRERLETKARFPQYALSVVIDALQQHGHLSSIVELLKLLPKIDVIWYLVTNEAGTAQEAAMRSGEGQYLLDLYDTARKTVGTWSSETGDLRARLESSAATFARQALGSLDVAKTLLREMINNPKTPSWRVLEGCNQLAEILLEDFRLSKDPLVKKSALEETLKLLDKPAEVLPHVYNAAESQMIITIALMLRRLGPALDFSSRLHATFANCTGELRDETGVNDSNAFRRLARVLICVPGFAEEASIALTLQLYIIDEDVRRKEQEIAQASQEKGTQASTDSESHTVNGTSDQDVGVGELSSSGTVRFIDAVVKGDVNHSDSTQSSINGTTDGVKITNQAGDTPVDGTPGSTTTVNEIDEGILENSWFYCNFCGKDFNDWSHGAAYLCVYCIDMDICEECYLKKLARERGEIEPDWRVVCPKGHRHVKAPIEGWRGIRAGTMRIGKDEILFKTWLAQLEIKWAKYWEDFWTDAETV